MNSPKLWIIVLFMFTPILTFARITFDASFENGRLDSVAQNGNEYTVSPTDFLHFRASGAISQQPQFRAYQGSAFVFRSGHRMVFHYAGENNWRWFDNGAVSGDYYYFSHNAPFTSDTVYIAYWYPYTFSQLQEYISQIQHNPYVQNLRILGYSVQNRPIYGMEVTDSSIPDSLKQRVVIVARQHTVESLGSYIIQGMMDYLLISENPALDELRRSAVFHFYPMTNPDGVVMAQSNANALGQDLNRHWLPGTPSGGAVSGCQENDMLRQAIWDDTGGQAAYAIDIHSHPGYAGNYYYWGLLSGPTPAMVQAALQLVERIHFHDAADHNGNAIVNNYITHDTWATPSLTADYWLTANLGAVGYTFEPGSVPPQSQERIEDVGVAICKALGDMLLPLTAIQSPKPVALPTTIALFPNYPNPFNLSTHLRFRIASALPSGREFGFVELLVFDIAGRRVKTLVKQNLTAGSYTVVWDGTNDAGQPVASGVYFYQMQAEDFVAVRKMLLLK